MLKYLVLLSTVTANLSASVVPTRTFMKAEMERRWAAFQEGRQFKKFEPGKSETALQTEFDQLSQTRRSLWKTPEFQIAGHLVSHDLVRAPGCEAFAFNHCASDYNASVIWIADRSYIACEGPRSKDIPNFFRMLQSEQISHLIRLTGTHEGWSKKCSPYWDELISEQNGNTYLNLPTENGIHSIQLFHMDYWRDNQGVEPENLLATALEVREQLQKKNGRLAVHCSAGVGRTGTFLAALAILDTIDQGLPLSIEEIVYRLSLQRVHSVAKPSQYITLHRMTELYLGARG